MTQAEFDAKVAEIAAANDAAILAYLAAGATTMRLLPVRIATQRRASVARLVEAGLVEAVEGFRASAPKTYRLALKEV
jgi:hypothetical protein